jgi:hypothetical protein
VNLRRPNQGVITQAIPGFYPDRMGAIALNWANTVANNYSPAGLYNNSSDGSALVIWSAEGSIAPSGSPASFDPTLLFAVGPNAANSTPLRFISQLGAVANPTSTLSIPVPPNTDPTQLLLTALSLAPGFAGAVTPPAGWNLITTGQYANYVLDSIYYKWSNGAEPDHYDWGFPTPTFMSGVTAVYGGVDPTTPIDNNGNNSNFSNAATTASVTFNVAGCMAVATFGYDTGVGNIASTPAGFAVRANQTFALLADQLIAGTSLGPQTLTFTGNQHWADTIIGLRPSQRTFVLGTPQPLIAGYRAPWGQSIELAQGANAFGTPYYRAHCASGAPTTSAGKWQWPHDYPFAVLAPGQALLVNLTGVASGSLSLIYEVTKYY